MKKWFTPAELASKNLPDVPTTEQGVRLLAKRAGWQDCRNMAGSALARRRKGRGGGWEYHYAVLPQRAQERLVARDTAQKLAAEQEQSGAKNGHDTRSSRVDWPWYDRLPERWKKVAGRRKAILDAVDALARGGILVNQAVHEVGRQNKVGASTIYQWRDLVAGLDSADWLPALAPRYTGRTASVECDPRAWEFIKRDYLRKSQPSFESCYQRLQSAAQEHGWTVPSSRTLYRRIEREIPKALVVLERKGEEALKRMFPSQERDRTMFHALEAVNADGHKWDVFVRWPDGTVGRPVMVAIQDLYSNKILARRYDRSENADSVRLAFGDVFRNYGIPDHAWLDNGRGFASKWITGGTPNRYRFKVKPEEPSGILTALGVEVHWTRPYSGQSKPIERAFRDFCDAIAKHPAFEGAYTGNKPDAKPENYGSRAIPFDEFVRIVDENLLRHNAREKRNTRVCRRQLSFDQAFEQSYAHAAIRKAVPEQLRMCLLAAESVRADRESGAVQLLGNRYWGEVLHGHRGEPLTLRFDPDALHDGVDVYRLDGSYVGFAECLEAAGFADTQAAREHARKLGAFKKATREAAKLELQMSIDEVARLLPKPEEPTTPDTKVVRPMFGFGGERAAAMASVAAIGQEWTEAIYQLLPEVNEDGVDEAIAAAGGGMTKAEYEQAFSRGLSLIEGGREDI